MVPYNGQTFFQDSTVTIEVYGGEDLTVQPVRDCTHFLAQGVEDLHRLASQFRFLAGELDREHDFQGSLKSLVRLLQDAAWNCRHLFPRRLMASHAAARGLADLNIDGVLGSAEESLRVSIARLHALPPGVCEADIRTAYAESSGSLRSAAELLDATAVSLADAGPGR